MLLDPGNFMDGSVAKLHGADGLVALEPQYFLTIATRIISNTRDKDGDDQKTYFQG